jgi:ribosomal-protein-alanine N-acetyltransferase
MNVQIQPIRREDAHKISTWKYEPPYSLYDLSEENIPIMLDPQNRYYVIYLGEDELVGYCCFGEEAMVSGGKYEEREPSVLDVGVGMRPRLVGQGLGRMFVAEILQFAWERYHPERFRSTIAAFNQRSKKTFRALGFTETSRFTRASDGLKFVQMEQDAVRLA